MWFDSPVDVIAVRPPPPPTHSQRVEPRPQPCTLLLPDSSGARRYELLTEGDSFLVAFHEASDALAWCAAVQSALYEVPWSSTILQATHHAECPAFRGLRVRMGVHSGVAEKASPRPQRPHAPANLQIRNELEPASTLALHCAVHPSK